MSVILEFTIDGEDFELGRVLSGPPDFHLELERVVPTGDMVMPFVWATGDAHEAFEESVRAHAAIRKFVVLDRIADSGLYRIEWEETPTDLIEGIARAEAVVLEAQGDGTWTFRLRFTDHEALSEFHDYLIDHDVPLHVERTYATAETVERSRQFDLTHEQREALVLALERGYFASPSRASLEELAEGLGISRQALSQRIRRGNETILRSVLLSGAADGGGADPE
jgi:predicted DNA binding protein